MRSPNQKSNSLSNPVYETSFFSPRSLIVVLLSCAAAAAQPLSSFVQLTIEKIRANPEVVKPGGQMEVLVSVHAKNVVMPIPQRYARLVVWRNSEQHDLTVKAVSAKGGMTASLGGFSTVASTKQVICRFKAPEEPGSYTYDVSVYYETKDGLSPAVWDTITFKVSDESAPTPKQTPARQAPSPEWEHLSVAENIVGDWIYSPSSLKHAGINLNRLLKNSK